MTLPRTGSNAETLGKISAASNLWGALVSPAQHIVLTNGLTH
jgi:hypothetical protein